MIQLLVIRHGKTDWNLERKLQGRRDTMLNDEGIAELRERQIPADFAGFKWVVSPLKRAQETASLLGASGYKIEPALTEMDWGDWEGRRVADLRAQLGDRMTENEARGRYLAPPNGESPAEVIDRLKPWLENLAEDTIAVTHKGVIRALLALAFDWDMKKPLPDRIDWTAAHLFSIDETNTVRPKQLNISMEKI